MKYLIIITATKNTYYYAIYSVDANHGTEFVATGSVDNSLLDTIAYSTRYILHIDSSYSGPVTIISSMNGYPTTKGSISISRIDKDFDYYHYAGMIEHEFDRIHKILK